MSKEKDQPDSWQVRKLLEKDCENKFYSVLQSAGVGDNYQASIRLIRFRLILESIDLETEHQWEHEEMRME